jgi:DNA repair protein SbcD/Mre11
MPLRILLTSDLHLGMKFAAYPAVQARLAEERFRCLDRIVDLANARSCDLLVVAGDLFERLTAPDRDVTRAAKSLARFAGKLAAVLPGNHDYLAPDDKLWRRFRDAAGDNTVVLDAAQPLGLEHFDLPGVCLYPAPCTSKHSRANAVSWVGGAHAAAPQPMAIGVAHGSLDGYSPDFAGDYYPMTVAELLDAGPRIWLLGHTHVQFAASPVPGRLVACAGTPEPDGFDCRHEGSAFVVTLSEAGAPAAEAVTTGGLRFVDEEIELRSIPELDALESRFSSGEAGRTLLRITLSGALPGPDLDALEEHRKSFAERLAFLDWRAEGVRRIVDSAAIDAEFPADSFPHALLSSLATTGDTTALQEAYELLQEARR